MRRIDTTTGRVDVVPVPLRVDAGGSVPALLRQGTPAPVFTTPTGGPLNPLYDAWHTAAMVLQMSGVGSDAPFDKVGERLLPATSLFGADQGLGW
jgi:hypothetical protein